MTDMNQTPSEQAPPMRPLLDQVRTAYEINETHRRHLVERIGILRAMSDDKMAEAQTYKNLGQHPPAQQAAQAAEQESMRLSQQADMLQQRVQLLLRELYAPPAPPAPPAPRLSWQRPDWWAQLGQLAAGLETLRANADAHVERLGIVGREAAFLAASSVRRALDSKPEDVATASMDAARLVQSAIEQIAPMPWQLVDVDPVSGAQTVRLMQQLCEKLPPDSKRPEVVAEQSERRFTALLDSLKDHREAGRFEAAQQHFIEGNAAYAAQILLGIAPPDVLRYEVNALILMLQSLAAS